MGKIVAWHFTGKTLRYGSPTPPIGHTLKMDGEIILCERGFHASLHPFDALLYAPGQFLHKVEMGGNILHQNDKLVASERTILQSIDATELLCKASRLYALDVIHLWNAPKVVQDFLKTGDEKLRDAALAAAWTAAWTDARAAALAATLAATSAAAWTAARDASLAATRAATRAASWTDARAKQKEQFLSLVNEYFV